MLITTLEIVDQRISLWKSRREKMNTIWLNGGVLKWTVEFILFVDWQKSILLAYLILNLFTIDQNQIILFCWFDWMNQIQSWTKMRLKLLIDFFMQLFIFNRFQIYWLTLKSVCHTIIHFWSSQISILFIQKEICWILKRKMIQHFLICFIVPYSLQ